MNKMSAIYGENYTQIVEIANGLARAMQEHRPLEWTRLPTH
jgi:hypothetical protein